MYQLITQSRLVLLKRNPSHHVLKTFFLNRVSLLCVVLNLLCEILENSKFIVTFYCNVNVFFNVDKPFKYRQ